MTNSEALLIEERVQPEELPALSPSSINLYIKDPVLWVLKHFYGSTSGFNIYAMRGVAVEEGLNEIVLNGNQDKAIEIAQDKFATDSFGWGDDELLNNIEAQIAPWVNQCRLALMDVMNPKGGQIKQQIKISSEIEGVPIIGYIDYMQDKIQVDLKTANQVPKPVSRGARKGFLPAAKKDNVRQQAIYKKATGLETSLLYVNPEEHYHHVLSDAEIDEIYDSAVEAVKGMKKLLDLPIEDVVGSVVPNWKSMEHSFYWDDQLRELAKDIWWEQDL